MLYTPPPSSGVGDHAVRVHSGLGHGSTATKIRRFTTVAENSGTAITYADSAVNGATFTINVAGLYEVAYTDTSTAAAQTQFGVTLNTAEPTIAIMSLVTPAARLIEANYPSLAGLAVTATITRTLSLVAGDVLRAHTNGSLTDTLDNRNQFSIRKVGNV